MVLDYLAVMRDKMIILQVKLERYEDTNRVSSKEFTGNGEDHSAFDDAFAHGRSDQ